MDPKKFHNVMDDLKSSFNGLLVKTTPAKSSKAFQEITTTIQQAAAAAGARRRRERDQLKQGLADTAHELHSHTFTYHRLQAEVEKHSGVLQDIKANADSSSSSDPQQLAQVEAIRGFLKDIQACVDGSADVLAAAAKTAKRLAEETVQMLNSEDTGCSDLHALLDHCLDSLDLCKSLRQSTYSLCADALTFCDEVTAAIVNRAAEAAKFECPICSEDKSVEDKFIVEGCHHCCCRWCAEGWARAELDNGRLPKCPLCQVSWCQTDMLVLEEELVRRFIFVQMHDDVRANSLLKCPNPDCCVAVERPEPGQGTHFDCPACGQHSCLACQVSWHEDSSCEAYQRWKAENEGFDDTAFKQWLRDNQGRVHKVSAGGCGHACLKEDCNSVWCSVCGFYFCWFCLQKIADRGASSEERHRHFREPGPCFGKCFEVPNWDDNEYN